MDVLRRLRKEYGYRLVTVASFHHEIGRGDDADVEHVTVGDGPDEADLAVINRTHPGDIVVTQDWGLAALALGKGALCLSPHGYEYTEQRIHFQLEERHLKAKHRRAGGRMKGPPARTAEDDERFERTLRRMLESRRYQERD